MSPDSFFYTTPLMPLCRYAAMPLCRYAAMPLCRYAAMPLCRYVMASESATSCN